MSDEKQENQADVNDLFVDDTFVHYSDITVPKKNNPEETQTFTFGFKEISGAEQDRISKNAASVNSKTGKFEIDSVTANVRYLQAVLVKAPFEITEHNIRKLSVGVRDKLLAKAKEVNEIPGDVEKK